jgi:phospholipid/cholesterol/gamma-HCH transport system ATP-binding protein
MTDGPMIEIEGLVKRFGSKEIYCGLDLRIEHGETHVIIGGSGVGKSVMLKHLVGLLRPDAGTIRIEGREIRIGDRESIAFVREKVGMVFQGGALFDSLTIRQNVGFSLDERGEHPRSEIDRRVTDALAMVDLNGVEAMYPSDLSGGMQKRVALARTVVAAPDIMLYDEPTAGLDPVTSNVINRLIRNVQKRLGVTSIVVTHDMNSAYKTGDRISMLKDGRIIETGTPEAIRASENPEVWRFIRGEYDESATGESVHAV